MNRWTNGRTNEWTLLTLESLYNWKCPTTHFKTFLHSTLFYLDHYFQNISIPWLRDAFKKHMEFSPKNVKSASFLCILTILGNSKTFLFFRKREKTKCFKKMKKIFDPLIAVETEWSYRGMWGVKLGVLGYAHFI